MTTEFDRKLLRHAIEMLQPILNLGDEDGLTGLLNALGWNGQALGITDPGVFDLAIEALTDALQGLDGVLEQENIELHDLAGALTPLALAVTQIVNLISSLSHPPEVPADALTKFGEDLMNFLLEHYVASRLTRLAIVLEYLGIFKPIDLPEIKRTDGVVLRRPTRHRKIDLGAVSQAMRDPFSYVLRQFTLDANGIKRAADAMADLIGPSLADGLINAGLTAGYGIVPEVQPPLTPAEIDAARHLLFVSGSFRTGPNARTTLRVIVALADETNRLSIVLLTSGDLVVSIPLGNGTLSVTLQGAAQPLLINSNSVSLATGAGGPVQFAVEIAFKTKPGVSPALRFGAPKATRFEIGEIQSSLCLVSNSDGVDLVGVIDLNRMLLAFQGSEGDGFLNKILPREPIEVSADIGIDASLRKGLRFRGSAGLEKTLPIHADLLGIIKVPSIYLALLANNSGIDLAIAANVSVKLGPLTADVERMGLSAKLTFPQGGGNLGPANVALGFKPPKGVGLSIDATAVVGGGYLFFDHQKEQYAGVLQLYIKKTIALKAVGLLTTRLPDGSKGFSLLVIITAEFPPMQLGFGFTLNGVGGLLGVNRTMVLEALRAGIKNRALDSIMFPRDPVTNAQKLISDLQSFFPPASGRFVFGPMVMLGWGTPPILKITLGIVLELPAPVRLAIMGQLMLVLPNQEVAAELQTVVLRMDVLGTIDFDTSDAAIDATLYDSRVATFPLTGDMAMRLNWGASPAFALSVGGFNPRFQPPPSFPALGRAAIALARGNNPRLRLESYLALTSNTVQFGARLDVYAEVGIKIGDAVLLFSVTANLGFDALVQFQPFGFVVSIDGSATVRLNGTPLLIVTLNLELSGPKPWHGYGLATFEFFGKRQISIDLTIGAESPPSPLPASDPLGELRQALSDARNWSAQLPGDGHALVTLRKIVVTNELLVHPFGELTVRQKVVPLDVAISKFGNTIPAATGPFTITSIQLGTQTAGQPREAVRDYFAPGQFFEMRDEEKLARPAFESLPAGCTRIGTTAISYSATVQIGASLQYDTVVIDNKEEQVARKSTGIKYEMTQGTMLALAELSAAGQSAMRSTGSEKFAGSDRQKITLKDPEYVVAGTEDMAWQATSKKSTYTEAEAARPQKGAASGKYQVVGRHEVK